MTGTNVTLPSVKILKGGFDVKRVPLFLWNDDVRDDLAFRGTDAKRRSPVAPRAGVRRQPETPRDVPIRVQ